MALRAALLPRRADDYEAATRRVRERLHRLEHEVARSQRRVEGLCRKVVAMPPGRLRTLIENSPPPFLAALSRYCGRASFDERFRDRRRSLHLAEIGLRAAERTDGDYLDELARADLRAEAWLYLANARRLSSDVPGAEEAIRAAGSLMARGTGDRGLKALACSLEASLRFGQGDCEAAARLLDREIRLQRLMGEPAKLGQALINRGIVAAWSEPLDTACAFFEEGVRLAEGEDHLILSVHGIAERLARDGEGLLALKAVKAAEEACALSSNRNHRTSLRWVKGIAYRALGEPGRAARELRAVRDRLVEDGALLKAAFASLDLAAAYVGRERWREVQELAEEAYAVFIAERLERRALAAFLAFRLAARAETLSEELAVKVANFLVRSQHDRSQAFEPPSL